MAMLADARNFRSGVIVSRRLGLSLFIGLAFGPGASGSIESAVRSLDAGHPSSRRTSLGESTPTYRARCQLA
jgi:hypothetical protein